MTAANIVLVFLTGFVGIMLWIIGVIALDILHDSHRTPDNRRRTAEPKEYDGYDAHDGHHASHRL